MTSHSDFAVRSFEEFNGGVGLGMGGVLLLPEDGGNFSATAAKIGPCQILHLFTPPHSAVIPLSKDFSGIEDALSFIFFKRGTAMLYSDGFSGLLQSSSLALYNRRQPFEGRSVDNTEHYQFVFPRSILSPAVRHHADKPFLLQAASSGLVSIFMTLLASVFEHRDALSSLAKIRLQSTLVSLAEDLIASTGFDDKLGGAIGLASIRTRAMCFIETQLEKIDSVEEIAAYVGCSPRHLHNAFAERNTTPSRYVWSLRLDRARNLLVAAQQNESISAIAFACGFKSYAHFSRAFNQRFGLPPRAFWKQHHPGVGGINYPY